MNKIYTDDERVQIAKKEYDSLSINDSVTTNNGQIIGYVSQVINNPKTGEQAFIITDGNPKTQKPNEVNHVTALFQGSLGLDNIWKKPGEVKRDWWENNKEIAKMFSQVIMIRQFLISRTKQRV